MLWQTVNKFSGFSYDVLYEETVRGKLCRERKIHQNRVKIVNNGNENENVGENIFSITIDLNEKSVAIDKNEKKLLNENENESEIEVEQGSDDDEVRILKKILHTSSLNMIFKFIFILELDNNDF